MSDLQKRVDQAVDRIGVESSNLTVLLTDLITDNKMLRSALMEVQDWLPEQKNMHEDAIKCIVQQALKDGE